MSDARNTNPENLVGLVEQTPPTDNESEWGGIELVQLYKLLSENWPALRIPLGTVHLVYAYLFMAGPGRHIRNGHAPGIDNYEATFRGAIFPDPPILEGQVITAPYPTRELSPDFISLPLTGTVDFLGIPRVVAVGTCLVNYDAPQFNFRYISQTDPFVPLFVPETYTVDATHPPPHITKVTITDAFSLPAVIVPGGVNPGLPVITEETLLERCDVIPTLVQFTSTPWGIYFEITESYKLTYKLKVTSDGGIGADPNLTCPADTATVATPYSSFAVANFGVGPYTYSISSGSLPDGLSLGAETGDISGTPGTPGAFTFTIAAADSLAQTRESECTITVS